jgi:hypothetical protein
MLRPEARTGNTRTGCGQDRGQVSIEFLGMVPVILLTLVLLWQFVLVGYTYTLAGNAADEAARTAAVTQLEYRQAECEKAARARLDGAWMTGDVADCDTHAEEGMVTAKVTLQVPVLFPGSIDFPFPVVADAGAVLEERY